MEYDSPLHRNLEKARAARGRGAAWRALRVACGACDVRVFLAGVSVSCGRRETLVFTPKPRKHGAKRVMGGNTWEIRERRAL